MPTEFNAVTTTGGNAHQVGPSANTPPASNLDSATTSPPAPSQRARDELTGLLDRQGLHQLLDDLLDNGSREHVAVVCCDLDRFNRINAALGHDGGDEVLVALARHITTGLPAGCAAARLSGGEFVLVCPDVTALGGVEGFAVWTCEYLHTNLLIDEHALRVSASIGAAAITGPGVTGTDLLRYADAALHQAKDSAPGGIAHADSHLITTINAQLRLETQLQHALNTDELELRYQPILTRDGTITAAEALLRWPHPDDGTLSPATILSVAEQGGLLHELDLWVLHAALAEATTWQTARGPVDIAINLSSRLPNQADFPEAVTHALARTGLSPHRVILEITETALLDLDAETRRALDHLAETGVRFAIDDFGTGYSSLARLKDLPAQVLKIDRRFVAGLPHTGDTAIIRAITDLARGLGYHTVAEGVETRAQRDLLEEIGVDAYQGFLHSPPIAAPEIETLAGAVTRQATLARDTEVAPKIGGPSSSTSLSSPISSIAGPESASHRELQDVNADRTVPATGPRLVLPRWGRVQSRVPVGGGADRGDGHGSV